MPTEKITEFKVFYDLSIPTNNTPINRKTMSKSLIAALEQIEEEYKLEQSDLAGEFNIAEDIAMSKEYVEEFNVYSDEYDNLVAGVTALESMRDVITLSDYRTNKVNYKAVMNIAKLHVKSIGLKGEKVEFVSTEGWENETNRKNQKSQALETISNWIANIWKIIKKFLLGIWNWIQELFNWQKIRGAKLEKLQQIRQKEVSDLKSNENKFDAAVKAASKSKTSSVKILAQEVIDTYDKLSRNGYSYQLDTRITDVQDKYAKDVVREIINSNGFTAATEDFSDSGNGFIESIYNVVNTVRGTEFYYNCPKGKNLISTELLKQRVKQKKPIALSEVISSLFTTQDFFNNYINFVITKYLAVLKKSITILTADEFDIAKASEILSELFLQANDFTAVKIGYVKDNQYIIDKGIVKYESISFSFLSKEEKNEFLDAFAQGKPIGYYLDKVRFTTDKLYLDQESSSKNPMIQLNKNVTQKDIERLLGKQSKDFFNIFESSTTLSMKYQNVITGLNRAVERVSKNTDSQESKIAALFVRAVLHSTNVYVNQPFVVVNTVTPDIIHAICDYADAFVICNNPVSVVSLF